MLESLAHSSSSFLTLTYSDENLPRTKGEGLPTLSPRDLQLWLKRFRKALSPSKVRYYAVGEYGDETERPHYHLVVFGLQTCARGRTSQRAITEMGSCCSICNLVSSTWGKGRVEVLPFSRELSNYIAGYVTKKLSQKDHPWLRGRHPEFVRQSKQDGGLGIGMVPEIASVLLQYDHEKDLEDVPIALAHGQKSMPLGQYLRRKLREHLGRDPKAPVSVREAQEKEVQPLRTIAFNSSSSVAQAYKDLWEGAVARSTTKYEIFKKRRKL